MAVLNRIITEQTSSKEDSLNFLIKDELTSSMIMTSENTQQLLNNSNTDIH